MGNRYVTTIIMLSLLIRLLEKNLNIFITQAMLILYPVYQATSSHELYYKNEKCFLIS